MRLKIIYTKNEMGSTVTMAHGQFTADLQALDWRARLAHDHHGMTYVNFISK